MPSSDGIERTAWPERVAQIDAVLSIPRATEGELTVEAALKELRELLPHSWAQLTVNANYDRNSYELHVPDFKRVKEFVGPTLECIVNELRTWAKSRESKGDGGE